MSEFTRKTEHKKEAGLALIWVLMVVAVTSALSLAFLQKVSIGISTTGTRSDSIQAQYLAEAAANHAMWLLLNEPDFPASETDYYMHLLGSGRYGYKVRPHTNTTFATVAVVGGVGDAVVHQSYVIYVKDAWYHRDWKYRRKISILDNVTDSDLTYFPYMVKVKIADTNNDLFMNAQLDGDDILFTDSDRKTKLDHELEKYISLDGIEEQVAWVKLPSLSSSDATEIYMYYGNHAAANQEKTAAVWNNDYVSVYHLHDDFEDSVGNHDGSNTGSSDVTGPIADAHPIADAQDFDPADGVDYIDIGTWSVSGEQLTIQAWIRSDDEYAQDDPLVIAKANGKDKDDYVWGMGLTGKKDDQVRFYLKTGMDDGSGTEELKSDSKLSKNTWHHVAVTYDDSLSLMRIIKDGQDDGNKFQSGDIPENYWQIHIGNNPSQDKDDQYSWNGKIDEVRISAVARPVDWMMAEYRNQNSQPETYLSLEDEEYRYLGVELQKADFDINVEGFSFSPNTFRGTTETYASGDRISSGGFGNDGGALSVQLGGIDNNPISKMSGGWQKTFDLAADSAISISFVYQLAQTSAYESDELSQVLIKVDNTLYGEGGGWWHTDWLNRTKITFDNTNSSEHLDDFPVLVRLNTTDIPGLDLSAVRGADVRFTDAITGNELKYEVESWDAATDKATVWVKVPRIDAGSNTDYIYVYHNYNGTATYDQSAADKQAVWDSNYQAVYHLGENQAGIGTADAYKDSTSNANHGDDEVSDTGQAGQIANGQEFDGVDDEIDGFGNIGNVIGTSNAVTLSTWIKHDNLSATIEDYFSVGKAYLRHDGPNSVGQLHFYIYTDDTQEDLREDGALTNDAWYHVVGTWDGTTQRVFINGVEADSRTPGGTLDSQDFGRLSDTAETLDGAMDEARISDTARSADWIEASYLSQNGTFAFCTFSSEGAGDYVAQIAGAGDAISTGWKRFRVDLGTLSAGPHTVIIGGYNNKKDDDDESTTIIIDDVIIWK